ncbi:MAG: RICIN domain-containing protein, partial [Anaerolineales bacterium]
GPCLGAFQIADTDYCTHGPDEAPAGYNVLQSVPLISVSQLNAGVQTLTCDGDGVTGYRAQAIYARAADRADRFAQYTTSLRNWVRDVDTIFEQSAAETGGWRKVRWVHDAGCEAVLLNVVLSNTADDNFTNTINELRAQGYNRTDRKYLIFMDATILCGIGNINYDDRPGSNNNNNGGPSYSRVDSGCWGGSTAAHELMHNLGGVQRSAPNTSGGGHCVDEYDVMCYSDSPNYPAMIIRCPDTAHNARFDCNHDDYYHTNPAGGSYLANFWNTVNSRYLLSAPPGTPTLTPTATPTVTGTPPTNTPTFTSMPPTPTRTPTRSPTGAPTPTSTRRLYLPLVRR